jgi:hypothetical protein
MEVDLRMPEILMFFATVGGLAVIVGVYLGRLSMAAAMDIGMLLASLTWLFLLVKIPWDLYFAARRARLDGQESQRLGIQHVDTQIQQLTRLERSLLWGALAAHILTALAIYVIGLYSPELVRPGFSWLFICSAGLRPAWEGYGYLRHRLSELASQVRYPREDIATLQSRVAQQQEAHQNLAHELKSYRDELSLRFHQLDLLVQQMQSKEISDTARLEKRTVQLSHRFEEVIEKMSSDQELLAGVRAFARLFREQPPVHD